MPGNKYFLDLGVSPFRCSEWLLTGFLTESWKVQVTWACLLKMPFFVGGMRQDIFILYRKTVDIGIVDTAVFCLFAASV